MPTEPTWRAVRSKNALRTALVEIPGSHVPADPAPLTTEHCSAYIVIAHTAEASSARTIIATGGRLCDRALGANAHALEEVTIRSSLGQQRSSHVNGIGNDASGQGEPKIRDAASYPTGFSSNG